MYLVGVRNDLTRGKTRGKTGMDISIMVVVVISRAGTIVVAAHIRGRGGVHASLDHGRRTGGE